MRNNETGAVPGRHFSERALCTGLWTAAVLLIPSPLWAIPSPDLVVNVFASAAQVLGLATVVLGGVAVSSRKRSTGTPSKGSRWAFRTCAVLFLVSLAANVLQYSGQIDRTNTRLRANLYRSSTEQGKQVGDVSLKTLSFSAQAKHPNGLQTEALAAKLEAGQALNLIDVREPEEVETGRIRNSWHIRYPDLRANSEKLQKPGAETVLLCFSGNRSSELCEAFNKDGMACTFLVGGYEKWLAENRELELAEGRDPSQLRDLPDYPNKETLLDTPEVRALWEEENVTFVDVRYPGEFERSALPKAVNVPMRKLPTEALWSQLKSLPRDRAIVAPCYDKRSSFYASILGLRLHRLGYDYRGRYTVPHEFVVPKKTREHVAQWEKAQQDQTLLGMVAAPLRATLKTLDETLGHLGLAILVLVLGLRLLISPLSVKADRDQIVQQSLTPVVDDLKQRLGSDPGRFSRALRSLYREERLTPLRNLCGSLLQVTLFLVFFSVVNGVAEGSTTSFLWIPELGKADPYFILPLLVGALIFAHLRFVSAKRGIKPLVLHILCGVLLVALTFKLRAAVNLYLCINIALLIGQAQFTRRILVPRERRRQLGRREERKVLPDPGIVPLRQAHLVPGTGNKAIRLGEMLDAGLPVPNGFSVTDRILSRTPGADGEFVFLPHERRRIIELWNSIGAERVAVRSSGLNEDGAEQSYAGIFESVLNVTRDSLFSALSEVHSSLSSIRASAYAGNDDERGGVLVQKMVPAEYAGVLFTEHPTSAGCSMVELVPGLGEALVSGAATPETYRLGRYTHRLLETEQPPIDLSPLLELGRKVEELFGAPQDIEWAYADGQFLLLQSRDITASIRKSSSPVGATERERHRLLSNAETTNPDTTLFAQSELTELLPQPSPFSLSFMQRLWDEGGSTDIACRALGVPYDVQEDSTPYVWSAFGRLYVNRAEERRRLRRGPGAVASFKLARAATAIEREFREEFLPGFLRDVRRREAIDFSRLRTKDLFDLFDEWIGQFIAETYVEAEVVNIAADFYLKNAAAQLQKRGMDPAVHLAQLPETVVHEAMQLLPDIKAGRRDIEEFLDLFGHRAPQDYELSQPRYRETPRTVEALVSRAQPSRPKAKPTETEPLPRIVSLALDRARGFQVLKEEAKHHCLRELALIRALLLAIDARLELGEGVFSLTINEVQRLREGSLDEALDLIDRRETDAKTWCNLSLPSELTLADLETVGSDDVPETTTTGDRLVGTKVAGHGDVVGRARVVHDPEEIADFVPGEILVTRFTDPTWTPLFPRVRGVVTEVGGWLSHAAIVAREYEVTAIVGAPGATRLVNTGDLIRLCADGHVQTVGAERRRHDRLPVSIQAAILRQGELVATHVQNLSRTGALIESSETLEAGQRVSIRIDSESKAVQAEVVRKDRNGSYALKFSAPIQERELDPSTASSLQN